VSAINLPGRGRRISEPARGSISEMADEIVAEMLPLLDRPFAFYGHCMGSIIMYEVAQRLKSKHDLSPVRLFAGGSMAPHLYQAPLIHIQDDRKFMDVMRLLDFTNTQAMLDDPEMRELLMPTLRADFEAVANYSRDFTHRERLSCPITGFAATRDLFSAPSSMVFWKDYTSADFQLWRLDVHHYFVETHRTLLLRQIAADLGSDLGRADTKKAKAALAQMSGMVQKVPLDGVAASSEELDVSTWLTSYPSRRERQIRLYCFPSSLGQNPGNSLLKSSVAEHAEICLIRAPKWEGRHPSLVDQARALARSLSKDIDGPFAFFGHCAGAILAYEVAQALRSLGISGPSRLFVSGAAAPHLYVMPNAFLLGDAKLTEVLDVIGHPLSEGFRSDLSLRARSMNSIRSDFEMMATYQYHKRAPLDCPITALQAVNDLWAAYYGAESWSEHTNAGFELESNDSGDHFHLEKDAAPTIDLLCESFGWGKVSGVHRVAEAVRQAVADLDEAGAG
jgi:medium-chain acyl-[acyl-carrier-protein] hydrolase